MFDDIDMSQIIANAEVNVVLSHDSKQCCPIDIRFCCQAGRGDRAGLSPEKKACLFLPREGGTPQLWVPCEAEERYTPHPG